MRNNRNLKENDLDRLARLISEEKMEEKELDEIFTGTKAEDLYQGVRGLFKGEGFGYFKYLSKIKNRSAKVVTEIEDIEKFMEELKELKPKVEKLSIAPEKKMRLVKLLDYVINKWEPFFPSYSTAIKEINRLTSEKLTGQRLDVIPGSKKAQIGKDLMKDKDKDLDDLSSPEEIDTDTSTTTTTKKPTSTLKTSGVEPKSEKEATIQEELSRFKQLIK